jgi:fused signal recognition particle receptor
MSEPIPYPTSQAAYPVTRPAATPQVHEPLRLDEPVVEESIAEAPVESEVAVANETFDHLLEGSGDQETEQVESAPEEVAPLNQPVFFALKPVGAPVIEPVEEPVTEPVEERRTAPVFGVREQEPAEESEPEDYEEPAEEPEPEAYEEPAEESELELVEEPQLETVEAQEDV